jgi:hypothetical protein
LLLQSFASRLRINSNADMIATLFLIAHIASAASSVDSDTCASIPVNNMVTMLSLALFLQSNNSKFSPFSTNSIVMTNFFYRVLFTPKMAWKMIYLALDDLNQLNNENVLR